MILLAVGDVVGRPGRRAFTALMPRLRREHGVEIAVVNGENAAGGSGITPAVADELFGAGAAAITTGDHVWDQREIFGRLDEDPRLLRPANYPEDAPGRGSTIVEVDGVRLGVVNVVGRVYMNPSGCPFAAADAAVDRLREETPNVIVDVHAEATSEKIALGRHLAGRVTAVVGTHTHVPTADEALLPGGTAYLTDLGMCGPYDSILGREVEPVLRRFVTGLPARFPVASGGVALCGAVIDFDEATGRARSIRRLRVPWEEA